VTPPTQSTNDVLSVGVNWSRRDVDQVTDPTVGDIINVSAAAGVRRAAVDNLLSGTFLRTYARYVRYLPLSRRNQLLLRAEAGYVQTNDLSFVPQDQLFRTGGAGTVRGYPYLSLGQVQQGAILGAGALTVGSIEGIHWFTPTWGGAVFMDMGSTGNDFKRFQFARGYGVGARWKTVAGPLALDLAYGERTPYGQGGRVRLHFAVAIAF
jgi:translocation and assembly module TamA